jgi:hypothetical protein
LLEPQIEGLRIPPSPSPGIGVPPVRRNCLEATSYQGSAGNVILMLSASLTQGKYGPKYSQTITGTLKNCAHLINRHIVFFPALSLYVVLNKTS